MAEAVKGVKGFYGGATAEELEKALSQAYEYDGLSLVHVPVYYGRDELSGLGSFGDWNVGNWCEGPETETHDWLLGPLRALHYLRKRSCVVVKTDDLKKCTIKKEEIFYEL